MIRMVFACAFIKFSFRTLNVKCVVDPHFWIALSMWTTACFTRIKYKKNDLNEHTNKPKMFDAFNAGIDELPTNALINALKFYLDYKPSYNRLTLQCWSHGDNAKNLIYAKNGFLLFLNKMLFKWHLTYASLSFFRNRLGSFYISLNIFFPPLNICMFRSAQPRSTSTCFCVRSSKWRQWQRQHTNLLQITLQIQSLHDKNFTFIRMILRFIVWYQCF